jgi:chemotaxis protein CheD
MIDSTRQIVVGVADCRVSRDCASTIVTYALGSCIAVTVHDPVARVGGMLHLMLPTSSLDLAKAESNPCMFADTGIPLLFEKACDVGAEKKRLVVHVAGGAQLMNQAGLFNIGRRNCLAVRDILSHSGVAVRAASIGGTGSRTVWLEVDSGRMRMRMAANPEQEL